MTREAVPRPRPGSRRPARALLADGHRANVYSASCPSRQALDRLADKWTALLVGALESGPKRFGQLREVVGGISEKMLTQTLRSLERDGLVSRQVHNTTAPFRVEYRLTPLGETVRGPLAAIRAWAECYIDDVEAARTRYDGV